MARSETRGETLRSLALRLGADEPPYYLHRPRRQSEPAPGWYWRPAAAPAPQYLGFNHYDAYARLHALLDQKRAGEENPTKVA